MTRIPPTRTLWFRLESASEGRLESLALDGLVRLPAAGPPEHLPAGTPDRESLVLVRAVHPPAGDSSAAAAVLLVSGGVTRSATRAVTVNGVRVGEGLLVLHHGDTIARGELRLWLSVDRAAEEGTYDPDIDGHDVFCARTKLRLEPGDPIVRCPGTPTRGCDLVFRASTWDASLRCHQCGHDPAAPRWTPPGSDSAHGTGLGTGHGSGHGSGALTARLARLLQHASNA